MLAVNLTSEIEELLDVVAKQTGQTSSEFVRAAILEKLEDTEDYLVAVERVRTMGRRYRSKTCLPSLPTT